MSDQHSMPSGYDLEIEDFDLDSTVTDAAIAAYLRQPAPDLGAVMNGDPIGDLMKSDDYADLEAASSLDALSAALLTVSTFAYDDLTPETAEQARAAAGRIQARLRDSYIETGADLLIIKELLGHGYFGKWLRMEFGWAPRTAENFMNAARLYRECATVSVLPATVVYMLAAPSTSVHVRDQIIAEINAGHVIDAKAVKYQISVARYEARKARASDREEAAEAEKIKGKTPAAIKARQKRKADREAAAVAAQKERERQEATRRTAAADAVEILIAGLGINLTAFAELHQAAGYEFDRAFRTAVDRL